MSIQYTLIFVLLSIEVVMFCLLILPFPSSWRKAIVVGLSQVPKIEAVKYSLAVLFLLVVVLFFDSARDVVKRQGSYHSHKLVPMTSNEHINMLKAEMFYAERNMYLTGFTLFLSLVLNRFIAIIVDMATAEEKHAVLIKQAAGNNKEYMKAIGEIERLNKLVADNEKNKTDLVAMKKQAEGLATEYNRLADQLNAAEAKSNGASSKESSKKDK